MNTWQSIGKTLGMLFIEMLCFLTVSTWKTKGMIAKNYQNHQKLWQKQWKLQQNKWKKAGDCISQQCSAVLSSVQSTTNFEVSWVFAGERAENEPNKYHKIHQKLRKNNEIWTKTMGTHTQNKWKKVGNWISQQHTAAHSAALSSAQSATNFKVSWLFARSGMKKVRTKPKKVQNPSNKLEKTMISGQNNGKTHTQNKYKKDGNLISQQHSAALSSTQQCSICNQFQGFLTFCRVRGEKAENEAQKKHKIHQKIGETMNSGQNKRKTQTKKREKGWELDFPAALSSTQQHSAVLNLQPISRFPDFLQGQGWKGENEAKKSTKSIKQIGETMNSGQNKRKTQTKKREKGWELDFPAALSSTQQPTNFKVSWLFAGSGVKKLRTKPKKKRKIHQNNGKTHKTNGKRLGIGFLSSTQQHTPQHSAALRSTQQHSAVLNLQPISRFPDFFQGQGWKRWERSQKKCKIHSNNLEKTMKSGQNNGKTHTKQNNGKRLGIGFPSSTQQHSAVLNLQPISRFPDFLQGQGWKSWERSQKKTQNPSKNWKNNDIWTKQWENTHKTNGKRLGIGFPSSIQQHSAALSSTQQCSICNQFQGFLTFCRVRGEKGENEAKKKRKIHQKHTQNKWKKAWNWISQQHSEAHSAALSSTQQHSAVLNLQPISRFPDFLQGQGWKGENEAKKKHKIHQTNWRNNELWTKQKKNTDKKKGKRMGIGFPSSTQQHSAALSSAQSATNFKVSWLFAGSGWKRWERSQKITQNQSKNLEKQCEKTHTKQMEKGMGLYFSPFLRFSHFLQGQGWKRWERSPKKSKIHQKLRKNNDIWTKQWEKQWACYWNAVFFCRSKKNKLRMMAKRMMAKNDQNHQKLWQKPWKLQQNKWKKAGDCISQQCSAVLSSAQSTTNFEVSWLFAGQGERGENEANK